MKVYLNSLSLNFISNIKDRVLNLTVQNQKILAITSLVFAIAAAIYIARRCWNKTTVSQASSNPLIPDVLAKIFKERSYNPESLPVLDLSDRENCSRDYITYISPKDMNFPVMRFTDGQGRRGVAVHVKGKSDATSSFLYDMNELPFPTSKINGVWTFHQRYTNELNYWVGAADPFASNCIHKRHQDTDHTGDVTSECSTCPTDGVNILSKSLFESLLTGQDPDLQLGNDPQFNLFAQA